VSTIFARPPAPRPPPLKFGIIPPPPSLKVDPRPCMLGPWGCHGLDYCVFDGFRERSRRFLIVVDFGSILPSSTAESNWVMELGGGLLPGVARVGFIVFLDWFGHDWRDFIHFYLALMAEIKNVLFTSQRRQLTMKKKYFSRLLNEWNNFQSCLIHF
jgi:hypothetical protein